MYRNNILTESEKQEILNQYKKPVNEEGLKTSVDYNTVIQVLQPYGFKCSTKNEKYKGQLICDGQTPQGKIAQFNMDSNGNYSLGVSGKGREGGVYKGGNFAPHFIKLLFSLM